MIHLTQDEFSELVEQAIDGIPPQFQRYMENLSVEVHPSPTRELLGSLDIKDYRTLLGLYHGVPLTAKSVQAPIDWPERIFIFQRNIEAMCQTPEDVIREVRTTILHEIGHHFGMDEQDLGDLGYS